MSKRKERENYLHALLAANCIAVTILSLTIGYWVGVGASLPFTRGPPGGGGKEKDKGSDQEDDDVSVDGSDDEDAGDADLGAVSADFVEECKLVCEPYL